MPRHTAINQDGSKVYSVEARGSSILVIDVETGTYTVEPTPTVYEDTPEALVIGPDEKVYFLRDDFDILAIYDPIADLWDEVTLSLGAEYEAMVFNAEGTQYHLINRSDEVIHIRAVGDNSPVTSASGNAEALATDMDIFHHAIMVH